MKFSCPLFFVLFFWCAAAGAQDSTHLPSAADTALVLIAQTDSAQAGHADPFSFSDSLPAGGEKLADLTKPIPSQPLSFRSVVVPSAMIAYGAFTFTSRELKNLNLAIRKEFLERNYKAFHLDDFAVMAPVAAVYGLNMAGVKGRHNFLDRSAIYGMSSAVGMGIVYSTKRLANVVRPDSSNRLSFPSGHTALAFIGAEFMRQEYKNVSPWYGVAAYAVAAGTGFLRMYNNKHWFNDVIAGAGVGILSTRISYWLYPKLKNAVFKEKNSSTTLMPTYQQGTVGIGLVHSF